MEWLPILPILIPLATAVGCLLAWGRVGAQQTISLAGSLLLFAASVLLLLVVDRDGIQVLGVGDWRPPFGIVLVIDRLSALMVLLAGVLAPCIVTYAVVAIDDRRQHFGFHVLLQTLFLGVCGAFTTGDLFNLYVWFEVLLISSFVLVALGGERAQLEGAIKYVTLNLLSSITFLAAVGIIYAVTGTLTMADIARSITAGSPQPMATVAASMLLVAFGIKAAVFPVFYWLPASYHTPPIAVGAVMAGLMTKVGVYSLVRVYTLIFSHEQPYAGPLLAWCAALTMIVGVLGAAAQGDIRRILAFHSISQVGYMILGLAIFTPLALAGTMVYIVHHGLVKTNLFLIAGLIHRVGGSYQLNRLGGLYTSFPGLGLLFLVVAMSLAGIPPLSGFWAKLALVIASVETHHWWLLASALGVSLLTLFSMVKIWAEAFWKPMPQMTPADNEFPEAYDDEPDIPPTRVSWLAMTLPCVVLAAAMIAVGVFAGPVFEFAERAAEELLNPQVYIEAVFPV
ncbi:MAG: Na+/H+ antiporter subunit D [Pirellulales bacterium]